MKKARELKIEHDEAPDEYRVAFAIHVLTCAVCAALLRQGWTFETAPGKPVFVVKNGERFNPRESIAKLAEGALSADDWKTQCQSMAIGTQMLSSAA